MAAMDPDVNIQQVVEVVKENFMRHITVWRDLVNLSVAYPELQDIIRDKCGPFPGKFLVDLTETRYIDTGDYLRTNWVSVADENMDEYLRYLPPARKMILKLEDRCDSANEAGLLKLIRSWNQLVIPADEGGKVLLQVDANRDLLHDDEDLRSHLRWLLTYNRDLKIVGPLLTHLKIIEEDDDLSYLHGRKEYSRMNWFSLPVETFSSLSSLKTYEKIHLEHVMHILDKIPNPDKLKVLKFHAESDWGTDITPEQQAATLAKLINLTKLELTIYGLDQLVNLRNVFMSMPSGGLAKLKVLKIASPKQLVLDGRHLEPVMSTLSTVCPALKTFILFGHDIFREICGLEPAGDGFIPSEDCAEQSFKNSDSKSNMADYKFSHAGVERVVKIVKDDLIRHVTGSQDLINLSVAYPELQVLIREECGPFQGKFTVDLTEWDEFSQKMDDYLNYMPPARKLTVKLEDDCKEAHLAGLLKLLRSWDQFVIPADKGGKVCLNVDANRNLKQDHVKLKTHLNFVWKHNRDTSIVGSLITHLKIIEQDEDDMFCEQVYEYSRMNDFNLPIETFTSLASLKTYRKIHLAHVMDILKKIPKPDKLRVLKFHAVSDWGTDITWQPEKQAAILGKLVNLTKLEITIYGLDLLVNFRNVFRSMPPGSLGKLEVLKISSPNELKVDDHHLASALTTLSTVCPALRKMILFGTAIPLLTAQ